ncbi:MAG TPA: hypothetical protein VFV38_32330 [Ktedonobacteraceae bacterium]|nr:hypothetical protein [Ktedonobacteraceae bacterium]
MAYREIFNSLYNYDGFIDPSTCQLRILTDGQAAIVVATELDSNEGTSVTNAYERIASKVVQEFGLNPQRTRFYDHYTAHSTSLEASAQETDEKETYAEVTLSWEGQEATDPKWSAVQGKELADLLTLFMETPQDKKP